MAPQVCLTVTFNIECDTPEEVETILWLSKHLAGVEWEGVLRAIGKKRLLELPLAVLGIAPRAHMVVTETHGARTVGDVVALSGGVLRCDLGVLNDTAYLAFMRRVQHFGLDLRD